MKKILRKLAGPIFFLVNLLASWQPVSAGEADISSFSVGDYLSANEGQKSVIKEMIKPGVPVIAVYLVRLINYMALTIGSFAFLAIVIGGFMMVTSAGNETQVQKGKDILKYAITGLAVALSAYFITAFVQSLFYENPAVPTQQ